jgi:ABC-type multidrug transport system ATPase subunit
MTEGRGKQDACRVSTMIAFEAVGKMYGAHRPPGSRSTVRALSDVTLEIPRGEAWAVVGPNGAGKSTLFGLLLGFLRPTEGRVTIDGQDPARYVRRHGAGYLPERFALPPEWPVRDALIGLARLDGAGPDAAARASAAIERFGLEAHAEKPVGALSRGLLQRVGLAQATLTHRDLVVLDEPTEGLDPLWRIRMLGEVTALRSRGATVLLASHDLAEVERTADRAVLLDAGGVREVLETRPADDPSTWEIVVAAPSPPASDAFPGARLLSGDDESRTWAVVVADAAELSGRLAGLLAAGAVVLGVRPLTEPLEERVRRALGEGE